MHMRQLLVWFVLIAAAAAQSVRHIRGVVVDENDRPVADVAVCPFLTSAPFITADLVADPATITKADGTFDLPWDPSAQPPCNAVLFVAKGRVTVAAGLGYVDMTPVIMPPARTLAGTVRGPDGKPVAGVRVEARDWLVESDLFGLGGGEWSSHPEPRTAVRSDASGRFVLAGTCDSAIALRVGGDGFSTSNYGPLAAGQSLDAVVERLPVVTVVVVDVAGKAMPGVMINTVEQASGAQDWGYTGANGEWRFTWLGAGAITVSASTQLGIPLGTVKLTEPEDRVKLLAQPPKPALPVPTPGPAEGTIAVRGRVVDSDGIKPMHAAYVRAVKPAEAANADFFVLDGRARGADAVRTAVDGSFVIHLAPGIYCLVAAGDNLGADRVMHGRERNPKPWPIQVVAGKDLEEVELRMQPVVGMAGKVNATSVPRGSMVRFVPYRPGSWHSGEDFDFSLRFPLAADGSFAAEGLLARAYQVQLLVPRGFRQGLPDKVALKVVEVADGGRLEVAVEKVPRGVVSGQVRSQVPTSRLAVMSLPVSSAREQMYGCVHYRGPVCPVQRDGSYELIEPLGERALLVVDLWSGVVLHRAEQFEVVPGKRLQDLEVTAVSLDVTWEDVSEHASPRLHIVVSENNWPTGLGEMAAVTLARKDCGLSVDVPRDAKSVRLWLQPGDTRLVLRKQHGVRDDEADVLANVIVDPSKQPQVRLAVRD